jgi:hypothetical protein
MLRPAGLVSHTFGVVGSAFMILMLSYSLRKRVRAMRNWGALSQWLDIHIFWGIAGPLLIVLHTSFKVQGLVAVSFWSMVAVASSGVFGRYLYLQIPRNIKGDEVDIKELEETNREYAARLQKDFGLTEEMIKKFDDYGAGKIKQGAGIMKVLYAIIKEDLGRLLRFRRAEVEFEGLQNVPHERRKLIVEIARRKALLNRKILLSNQVQQLFHYWHVIHKPFAVIMYTIMVVHIVVALWTGYKWIF